MAKTDEPMVDADEDNPFSQYYGMLLHQQNMLQDHVRTSTYERAMLANASDFAGKVVLDVGTGSGILAYFAIKAGAKRVYAVELSAMADCARKLLTDNGLADRIIVLRGKVEEVELPEKVDIVISEPMGFFLVHERMLESYVSGRIKWMKPGGLMFPSIGTMFVAPFSDDAIYQEQMGKVSFWRQRDFYGLNLSSLVDEAMDNHFSQPVVGYFSPSVLISGSTVSHTLDFGRMAVEDFHGFDIPFQFTINRTSILHGLACWFTVDFIGSTATVVLSTAPSETGTHWYQCRLLLKQPIAVNSSQSVSGNLHFVANKKFSYDIDMEVRLDGTTITSTNQIRLHDQMYHYMYNPPS
ncbi:histone-arginine methyltransferase CARM1 [Saprolegnia diclina VS20]|uniref:type I protein arginine methyltransferase n=1 Tax=Saprolegnia diclina (strain VS20) TaxID=1156394 RepID=T0PNW0_SAPDV|nr:histone-arginine methyltransferase CARM1 [Saprolegnia diclina VS20]EQC27104.1 histone-arginine methyltransferase CARM1 [Saprolegnia diclina VS20]|eukprot:XP_008619498.1 histone-arginine methyltransferase CARM1 [Saprolegnia diclina VS20]